MTNIAGIRINNAGLESHIDVIYNCCRYEPEEKRDIFGNVFVAKPKSSIVKIDTHIQNSCLNIIVDGFDVMKDDELRPSTSYYITLGFGEEDPNHDYGIGPRKDVHVFLNNMDGVSVDRDIQTLPAAADRIYMDVDFVHTKTSEGDCYTVNLRR